MTTNKQIGIVLLAVAGGYLVWRLNEAKRTGGPVTFVNPFETQYLPGEPSPAGSEGGGATNPFSGLIDSVKRAFKLPGNVTAVPALPAAPGTPVDPISPPDRPTLTAQPEGPRFLPESGYLPNLGDPNFSSWNYLASTPPDLAWGLKE